jgi:ubiquitin C
MQIFVKSLDSSTYCLSLDSTQSVGDLKQLVAARTGVPVGQQRLVHAGKHMADQSGLLECGLEEESTVRLLLRLRGGTMNIHVKILGGKSILLQPSGQETTITDLQKLLEENEGLSAGKYELMFCGQKLEASRTLLSYQISAESTLDAVLPSRLKGRCAVTGCVDRVAKVVGDCRYCGHGYCSKHRLPESHECDNMQGCRQQSYEKNSSKLMGEKCVADKV